MDSSLISVQLCWNCLEYEELTGSTVTNQVSRKRLDDDDFLVDAETVKHAQ